MLDIEFTEQMEQFKLQVDETLSSILDCKYPEIIYDAMAYSVFAGGKRVRPILFLSAVKALGGCVKSALPFATAIEMIHTYSLIHDDLPALDDDNLRRGRPTNHIKFGEAVAILAGDGLLNLAYETMANETANTNDENKRKCYAKAMNEIAKVAGVNGMIGGQVVDICSENKEINFETLTYILEKKTAALIKGCLKAGALFGGANDEIAAKFEAIGMKLGVAFQIKDDILDVTSTDLELGKSVFSDEKNNKPTYVKICGLEKAQNDYNQLSSGAVELLESLTLQLGSDDFLAKYAALMFERKT